MTKLEGNYVTINAKEFIWYNNNNKNNYNLHSAN